MSKFDIVAAYKQMPAKLEDYRLQGFRWLNRFFPDQNFFHPGSWIPDPHQRNFSILTKKNGFSALRNMIWVFHPESGSRIRILTFYPSRILILYPRCRIQGSKRPLSPDPGSGFATLEISDLLRL
jgi:hypothetical protein